MLLLESKPGRFGRAFAFECFAQIFCGVAGSASSRIGEWLVILFCQSQQDC